MIRLYQHLDLDETDPMDLCYKCAIVDLCANVQSVDLWFVCFVTENWSVEIHEIFHVEALEMDTNIKIN